MPQNGLLARLYRQGSESQTRMGGVMSYIDGPQSRFYDSRGLRLHYLDWGNAGAPLLILLHGGLEHARVWDQLARQLCAD